MSTPPNNPYAHNPDDDESAAGESVNGNSGSSPYGPPPTNPYGTPPSGAPGPYDQPPSYGQIPTYGQSPYGGQSSIGGQLPYSGQEPFNQQPYGGQPPYGAQHPYTTGPYTGGGMGWGVNTSKNSLGGWALGTGIAGVVCCGISGIAAIILGSMSRTAADQGLANNKGMGTAGLVLGIVGVAMWGIGLFARNAYF